MTTNTVITSQSIGTGSNVGADLFPQKLTIASTTTAFAVTGSVTNGAGGYDQANRVQLRFASSPISLSAAAAPAALRAQSRYLEILPSSQAGSTAIRSSEIEVCNGNYIYLWCDIPGQQVAQTLSVFIVELP